MTSYTRNLLISSALVFLGFSNMAVGSETLTTTRAEESHLVRQQENPVCGNMPVTVTGDDLKAWGIRPSDSLVTSFFKSLFGPFIQDAPQVLETVAAQKEKLAKEGVVEYTSNVGSAVGEAIIENPLDAIILGGALASGFTSEECKAILQLTAGIASGLKNSQALWAFAHSLGKDKERLQFVLYSAAALYALQSLTPVAGALLTPEIGETFKMNQNAVSNSPVAVAGLTNGNFAGVWTDKNNPPNLIGRIFFPNGTAVTNEFTVNTQPTNTAAYPAVSGLTSGKFIVTWQDQVPSITARIFNANGGAATNSFTANQVTTYQALGNPSVTGLTNGDAFIAWCGTNSSGSYIPGRVFSSTGGAVTNEFNINQAGGVVTINPSVMGLAGGNALAAWYSPGGFLGRIVFPNATFGGNEFIINQTKITSSDILGAALADGSALVTYETSSGLVGHIIQNGAPSGNEFLVTTNSNSGQVPVAGLVGDTALTVWPNSNVNILGKLFDSTGTARTNQFSVAGANDFSLSVSGLSNGGAVVAWGNATAVYGSKVSFPLPPTPTPTPTPKVAPTPVPVVVPTPAPTPTSAASGLASSFATLATSALLWYYGGN